MTASIQKKGKVYYVAVPIKVDGKWKPQYINTTVPIAGNNVRKAERARTSILSLFEAGMRKPETDKIIKEHGVDYLCDNLGILLSGLSVSSEVGVVNLTGQGAQATMAVVASGNGLVFPGTAPSQKPGDMKFVDLIGKWKRIKKTMVEPLTWEGYEKELDNHIIPYFDALDVMASDITMDMVQDYYLEKLESGRLDGNGPLAINSVLIHKTLIKQCLDLAVDKRLLDYNPSLTAKIAGQQPYEADWYNLEDSLKLLRLLQDPILKPIVLMTLYYGFRRSEVLGLKWSAIDFEEKQVTVKFTVTQGKKLYEKKKTKNKSSKRTYPLHDFVIPTLKHLKAQQEHYREIFGKDYIESGYVFTWPNGTLVLPDYVSKHFPEELVKLGMERIRFHDLRHTCGSLLYAIGYELKDIMEWLGHSDIRTTMRYVHLGIRRKIGMANKFAEQLEAYSVATAVDEDDVQQMTLDENTVDLQQALDPFGGLSPAEWIGA